MRTMTSGIVLFRMFASILLFACYGDLMTTDKLPYGAPVNQVFSPPAVRRRNYYCAQQLSADPKPDLGGADAEVVSNITH